MPDTLCKCGCGEKVYAASKSGFLRGHRMRGANDAATPPATRGPTGTDARSGA